MAWIESHQEIGRHPKTRKLARILDTSVPATVGYMHLLWHWCLDFAEDGDLSCFGWDEIADGAMWESDSSVFVQALIDCGWIDNVDGSLTIHDWEVYTGRIQAMRENYREANRERQRRYRERQKALDDSDDTVSNSLRNVTETLYNGPTKPNLTKPNQPETEPEPEQAGEARAAPIPPWSLVEEFCEIVGMDPSDMGGERGKQARTAKSLLARHPRDDILSCARWLWSQPFWRSQGIDLITVGNQMTKWVAAGRLDTVSDRASPATERETVRHHPKYWNKFDEDVAI